MPGVASLLGLDHFESFHCIDDVTFHKDDQHAWKRGHALGAIH
jgi:hypothetical protein